MLTLDGRTGGGQLLRTALGLSAITGTPFELEHVRAGRPEPGMLPQHLAAVRAVATLCDAEVSGAASDSAALTFRPGSLTPESVAVDIGTAGSVTLVFDTILPLATGIDTPFQLTATGGTDVKWAPTIGYFGCVKLPLLRRFGYDLDVGLGRSGFYPAGGGSATFTVRPSTVGPLTLHDRGALRRVSVASKASADLANAEVADRQAERAVERLDGLDLPVSVSAIDSVDSISTGSSLLLIARYRHTLAGFVALGERGKPSEAVADDAVDRFLEFHAGAGAVDEHLGDQLLVPLALAGGTVRLATITDHVESNLAVVNAFGFDVRLQERSDGSGILESS